MTYDPEIERYLQGLNIPRGEFTSQERIVLQKIINELERSGRSKLLDSLYEQDYQEKPVTMYQFIHDPLYAGNATRNGAAIWDSWKNTLYNMFDGNNQYISALFTGAIGIGKSTVATVGISYILYKLLCLKDPAEYYGVMPGSKPGIALFNITLAKGQAVMFSKLMSICRSSPWFLNNGREVGNTEENKIFLPDKDIMIVVGSNSSHFVGLDTFAAALDEISEKDSKEIDMLKMKAYDSVMAIFRRMKSRFMDSGMIPGMLFLISSTKTEDDFMSQYKETQRNDPNVLIIEKPLWEAVPKERYSGKTFKLAMGTKSTNNYILESTDSTEQLERDGFIIYDVPVEHRKEFEEDIEGSIRDILGQSIKTAGKFITADKVEATISENVNNILSRTDVQLGFDDGSTLFDYVQFNKINQRLIRYPMFVHHDIGLTGDKFGLCLTAVSRDIENDNLTEEDETKFWKFIPVLWCRISPSKKGEQVPIYKVREFIVQMRDRYGFNIIGASADGYQSAELLQQYKLARFWTELISMDKSPSNGYMFFRSCIYTQHVDLPKDEILIRELTHLIENRRAGKVDHEINGSKDLSDAFGGSIYAAVVYNEKHKMELFSQNNYLYADLFTGTNDSNKSSNYKNTNHIDLEKETDSILRDIGKGLFSEFDSFNSDDGIDIY